MKSIALVIPYFGKMPQYYHLWEVSAIQNSTIDFIIFTDIEGITSKHNIIVHKMTFEDFKNIVQSKFNFEISFNSPYKACDFKPTYGYVLEEYLKDYDFWGHCDIDLIFGDIRKFMTEDLLDGYDKIFTYGHFLLYRNTPELNQLFMHQDPYPEFNFEEVLSSNDIWAFDEFYGMNIKARKAGIIAYENENAYFDVEVCKYRFNRSFIDNNTTATIFSYERGKLYEVTVDHDGEINNTIESFAKEEIMYAHFQKRTMIDSMSKSLIPEEYLIIPNRFVENDIRINRNMFYPKKEFIYVIKMRLREQFKSIKKHLKRYSDLRRKGSIRGLYDYLSYRKMTRQRFKENLKLLKQLQEQ